MINENKINNFQIKENENNINKNTELSFNIESNPSDKIFQVEIDIIISEIFQYISPDSKQEVEFIIKNLEYELKYNLKNINNDSKKQNEKSGIYLLFYKILNHSEFNTFYFEDLNKIISLYNQSDEFFNCLLEMITINQQKNLIKISPLNKVIISQENFINFPVLNFLIIYNFLNSNLFNEYFSELDHYKNEMNNYIKKYDLNPMINNSSEQAEKINIFFEMLKINSSCLLDSYAGNLYEDEIIKEIIPNILKNLVIIFLKIEKESDKFLSYFIYEILNKKKNLEFLELAIEVYIEKKDFIKLSNLLTEVISKNKKVRK